MTSGGVSSARIAGPVCGRFRPRRRHATRGDRAPAVATYQRPTEATLPRRRGRSPSRRHAFAGQAGAAAAVEFWRSPLDFECPAADRLAGTSMLLQPSAPRRPWYSGRSPDTTTPSAGWRRAEFDGVRTRLTSSQETNVNAGELPRFHYNCQGCQRWLTRAACSLSQCRRALARPAR